MMSDVLLPRFPPAPSSARQGSGGGTLPETP